MTVSIRIAAILLVLFGMIAVAQDSTPVIVRPVGEAAFIVPARGAKDYKFAVPAGANSVSLEGRFIASGGPRNSIEVWVMNDDQFANWANRHPLTTIYNSQKVTQETIKVPLPSGNGIYHVVFNNEFSVLTPKAVQASLTLRYAK
jgi:hypothetical protein